MFTISWYSLTGGKEPRLIISISSTDHLLRRLHSVQSRDVEQPHFEDHYENQEMTLNAIQSSPHNGSRRNIQGTPVVGTPSHSLPARNSPYRDIESNADGIPGGVPGKFPDSPRYTPRGSPKSAQSNGQVHHADNQSLKNSPGRSSQRNSLINFSATQLNNEEDKHSGKSLTS